MKGKLFEKQWVNEPISVACEVLSGNGFCGKPTTYAYPAMNRGWQSLCHEHAQKHLPHAIPITELVMQGQILIKRDQPSTRKSKRAK